MHGITDLDQAAAAAGKQRNPMARAIWGASIGTAFEWYEFILYGALAAVLAKQFFSGVDPTTGFIFALLTFAVGFMMRPLGAAIFGHIGDMIGRKRTFIITIAMMGVATIGVGCLPTYRSIGIAAPILLISLRILQGIAAGGEYGGALTYVAEYSPPGRRALNMSYPTSATNVGLLMSFLAIMLARSIAGDEFDQWGWRLPFLFASVLLAISLVLRMRMDESPAFERLKKTNRVSKAPLKEALTDRRNVGRMLIGFSMAAGMTCMYYIASLYPTFFLTQLLKVDAKIVNNIMIWVTLICLPVYYVSGWICDRIGRKKTALIAFIVMALAIFPLFHALTHFANPALEAAQSASPVTVDVQQRECSLMFNPTGTARFTSSCDIAKQALTNAGVNYTDNPVADGAAAVIRIGNDTLPSYDAGSLAPAEAAKKADAFKADLRARLNAHGYPEKADPAAVNVTIVFLLIAFHFSFAVLAINAVGPAMVELFPTRLRYTSMSLPYNLATGWVGGLLPTLAFAISAQKGNIYAGLWYPLGWTVLAIVVVAVFFRETKDVDINADH